MHLSRVDFAVLSKSVSLVTHQFRWSSYFSMQESEYSRVAFQKLCLALQLVGEGMSEVR